MNKKRHYRHIIRRVIFALLIISAFLIQCSVIPASGLSFPIFLLIPLTVSTAMFEKEFSGFFFGAFAGALWDLASNLPDGLLALALSIFACTAGLLSRYIIRNTLLNALILTLTGLVLYSALALFCIPGSLSWEAYISLIDTCYLPACLTALILCIPTYFIIRAISLKFREENI